MKRDTPKTGGTVVARDGIVSGLLSRSSLDKNLRRSEGSESVSDALQSSKVMPSASHPLRSMVRNSDSPRGQIRSEGGVVKFLTP